MCRVVKKVRAKLLVLQSEPAAQVNLLFMSYESMLNEPTGYGHALGSFGFPFLLKTGKMHSLANCPLPCLEGAAFPTRQVDVNVLDL